MLVRLADTWSEAWTLDRGGWWEPRDRRRNRILLRRRSRIFLEEDTAGARSESWTVSICQTPFETPTCPPNKGGI